MQQAFDAAKNHFILTPFFLDQPRETLKLVAESQWTINSPALPEGEPQTRMSALYASLAQTVAETIQSGARPVSIAGDCCAAIGVVAGLQCAGVAPVLLWLDAHGDFNTWETTPSGFLGGMPLAMLVGRGEQTMPRAVDMKPLEEARVVLCDARDLDAGEKIALAHSQVHHITNVFELLNNDALSSHLLAAPLYVHFDTDIVNPNDAPAQSYATPGGPSAQEMKMVLDELARTHNIIAISMCAWNPGMDTDGKTRAVSMELLRALAGEKGGEGE